MSASASRATGTTTDNYVTALTFDSFPGEFQRFAVRVEETGTTNGITFKVQGTLNDEDWDNLILLDETGADHSATDIAVTAGSADQAFVAGPASARSGVNACYGRYRVQVKATVAASQGDYQIDVLARD